jgi:hypothetical protein
VAGCFASFRKWIRRVIDAHPGWNRTAKLSESKLQTRRESVKQAFQNNDVAPASVLTYLEEAYYFVPVHLGLLLQKG